MRLQRLAHTTVVIASLYLRLALSGRGCWSVDPQCAPTLPTTRQQPFSPSARSRQRGNIWPCSNRFNLRGNALAWETGAAEESSTAQHGGVGASVNAVNGIWKRRCPVAHAAPLTARWSKSGDIFPGWHRPPPLHSRPGWLCRSGSIDDAIPPFASRQQPLPVVGRTRARPQPRGRVEVGFVELPPVGAQCQRPGTPLKAVQCTVKTGAEVRPGRSEGQGGGLEGQCLLQNTKPAASTETGLSMAAKVQPIRRSVQGLAFALQPSAPRPPHLPRRQSSRKRGNDARAICECWVAGSTAPEARPARARPLVSISGTESVSMRR